MWNTGGQTEDGGGHSHDAGGEVEDAGGERKVSEDVTGTRATTYACPAFLAA